MLRKISSIRAILLIFLIYSSFTSTYAQVTIGSNVAPVTGALLDLKQAAELTPGSQATSTKGLLLPRVHLTSKKTFVDIGSGSLNPLEHTGLMVYNVNNNSPFCKNVYIWTSTEWHRLGPECESLLLGLQDIDFGISALEKRNIKFKTNSSWKYTADDKLNVVLSSYAFQPNVEHAGGTEENIAEISFDIYSGDNTPAAGEEIVTKMTFETIGEGKNSQTINVKRKSPSFTEFKSISPAAGTTLSRTGAKVTATVKSNDIWKLSAADLGATMQRPKGPLAEESLSIDLPTLDSWEIKNFKLVYTPHDSNLGNDLTAKEYAYKQRGFYYELGTHVPSSGSNSYGDEEITFKQNVKGDGKVKIYVEFNKGGDITTMESSVMDLTTTELPLNYLIPINEGDKARTITSYIETVGGEDAGQREKVFSGSQWGQYFYWWEPAAGSIQQGTAFGQPRITLRGKASEEQKDTLITFMARAKSPASGSYNTQIRYSTLTRERKQFAIYIPTNSTGSTITWEVYAPISPTSPPNTQAIAAIYVQPSTTTP